MTESTGHAYSLRRINSISLLSLLVVFGCGHAKQTNFHQDRSSLTSPAFPISNAPGAPARVAANNSQLNFGRGYDSLTGEVKDICIDFSDADIQQPTPGSQQGYINADVADWTHDLTKQMNINATASFGFGIFANDASFNYMSTGHLHRYGQYLFISENLENERQLISPRKYSLVKGALDKLKKDGIQGFIDKCGDEFVEGKITGGNLLAILKVDGSTESEQTQAAGSLQAAAYGSTLNVSAASEVASLEHSGRMSFQVARQGPTEDWPSPDATSLMQYALEYPCKVGGRASLMRKPDGTFVACGRSQAGAWTQQFLLRSYDELLDRTLISKQQVDFYAREAPYIRALYVQEAGLAYIRQNPTQFGFLSINRVDLERSKLQAEINKVTDIARKCAGNSKSCQQLDHLGLRPLPNRIDAVWQPIAVRDVNYQPVSAGQVIGADVKVLEATGSWYANGNQDCTYLSPTPSLHMPAAGGIDVKFFNRKTGKSFPFRYGGTVRIPPDTDVSVRVADGENSFGDNCQDPTTPVMVRAYYPAFEQDVFYPQDFPKNYGP